MNRLRLFTAGCLALPVFVVSSVWAEIPSEDLEKIRTAAPFDAPARPKKPRKVLVFSLADGYRHQSIPWGAEAFRILGKDDTMRHSLFLQLSFDLLGNWLDFNASLNWEHNRNPKTNAAGITPKRDDLVMTYGLEVEF